MLQNSLSAVARGFLLEGGDAFVVAFDFVNVCAIVRGAMTAAEIITTAARAMRRSVIRVRAPKEFMQPKFSFAMPDLCGKSG